jgi:hypothetical protein
MDPRKESAIRTLLEEGWKDLRQEHLYMILDLLRDPETRKEDRKL